MSRVEDSRVKIPALVHLTRLGYKYFSIKSMVRGIDYDPDTNIFYECFTSSINKINGTDFSVQEVKKSSCLTTIWARRFLRYCIRE